MQDNGDIEGIGKQSVCNNAEMRQFRITYILKEQNSAWRIKKQSVYNNVEMRQFRITYILKEPNSAWRYT